MYELLNPLKSYPLVVASLTHDGRLAVGDLVLEEFF